MHPYRSDFGADAVAEKLSEGRKEGVQEGVYGKIDSERGYNADD